MYLSKFSEIQFVYRHVRTLTARNYLFWYVSVARGRASLF